MNVKSWIPLVMAVVLGLIAMVVAKKALNKTGNSNDATVVAVAVANRDIPPGKELTPEDITITRMQADVAPGMAFRTPMELDKRTTLQPLVKGQAIVEPLLAPKGTRGGLGALIPEGYRAMTIEINEFTGLAGMLAPGARVDVVAVLRDDKTQQPVARTILQNIQVTAVGRNVNPAPLPEGAPPPPPSNNVTLLVTPKDAHALQLASQGGRPWLVLRNENDKAPGTNEATSMSDLRDGPNGPHADMTDVAAPVKPTAATPTTLPSDPFAQSQPPRAAARVVKVIRGTVESTVTFSPTPKSVEAVVAPTSATPATQPTKAVEQQLMTGVDAEPVTK